MSAVYHKPEDLKQFVDKWSCRLGLSDWDIRIGQASCRFTDNALARTKISASSQIAEIFIMHQDDRQKNDPNDEDMELDILHELIHVRLWAIDPQDTDETTHICREQAIDWIAKALINTDRKTRDREHPSGHN